MNRPIEALFAPRSVAVFGASARPGTWGWWLARGALAGAGRRPVQLINPRTFQPEPTGPIDLAVIAVPAAAFESTVEAALAAGARAVVGVTAGLPADREASIASAVRAAGAVLLGPNCLGVFDAEADLRLIWGDLPAGRIGLVSQSGNLALELGTIARRAGLGFSRFASVGDAADLGPAELLRAVAGSDRTRALALYLESMNRSFFAEAARIVAEGKPVALLAAGRSRAGAQAARSHTGALATDAAVLAAACREAGVLLVDSPTALIESTRLAALRRRPRTVRRIGIVADGGGHGIVATDLAVAAGLEVPLGPVDLAGAGERDLGTYARAVRAVADSGEVDAVLLTGYFGAYTVDDPALAERECAVASELADINFPVYVHSMGAGSPVCDQLVAGGVPVWPAIEHAIAGMCVSSPGSEAAVNEAMAAAPATSAVRFPAGEVVTDAAEALAAADRLGYPVVLKALGIAHKTDVRAVALDLSTADDLQDAFEDMAERLAPAGFRVEEMVDTRNGIEFMVGVRRDPAYGPVVLVGLGGVTAELLADVAVGLAPLDAARAQSMVDSLRGVPLLRGYRGRARLAEPALVELLVHVSARATAEPGLIEWDLNPVLVTVDGVMALDSYEVWARALPRNQRT